MNNPSHAILISMENEKKSYNGEVFFFFFNVQCRE
jgi:hypothetical protein